MCSLAELNRRTIAPLWHTLILLACLLSPSHLWLWLVKFLGVNLQIKAVRYAIVIAIQWIQVLFVAVGLELRGRNLTTLIGRTWTEARYLRDDLKATLVFSLGTLIIGVSLFIYAGSPTLERRPTTILPQSVSELIVWIPLAISTGLVEELIYRGYFLQQAFAVFRRMDVSICVQATVFSLAHGYDQTLAGFGQKLVLGLLFGGLVSYRKSLIPAMISHSIFDLLAGIARLV